MEKKDTLSSCSETKDVHAIKYKMSKAKERCMVYFRSLHSHLQVLSKDDLKGTRIEYGFKRAFMSLFGQDVDTFTSTMLLNVDQLQKQLDKDEFQEDGSMAAFWVDLFDFLSGVLNLEVNDIRAERIAKSANLLALIAAAQPYSDNYYQAPKPQRSNATSSSTRPSASTRHKGKEIAKPITPQSESVSVSDEDSDPEQAQRDKEMQKNLALLAKYFKKLYKPTNNNLRTSSNSRNKTEDTTPRYNNRQSVQGSLDIIRTMTVAEARETVGSQVVQQTGIQCFNCKGYGHYAKECRKPKRVKDYAYHKEKMMMCKQAEQGVPLQAEQADWLEDTDEEIDEQELEAHYSYMAKIQRTASH
ncbi:hypothetical protein Tco_0941162 [Tanacetum coccineum]|uniref:CCHC-type domain-containing protein n=1 Tax=Tanacetum coccineum TaxID=301880 RepID=A0ABQ5DSF6_9ASTR